MDIFKRMAKWRPLTLTVIFTVTVVLIGYLSTVSPIPANAQTIFLDRSSVIIIATALTDPAAGGAGVPSPNRAISPAFDPVVRTVNGSPNHHEVTIDVPDMDPTRSGPRAGLQEGIASGATVTVTLFQPVFPRSN